MTFGWTFVLGWACGWFVVGVWMLALGLCVSSRDEDDRMRRFMGGDGT